MRHWLLLLPFAATVALGCGTAMTQPAPAPCAASNAAATVTASDNFTFTPATVTVRVGQSVCWQNTGKQSHTVTEGVMGFQPRFAGDLPSGQAYIRTLDFASRFTIRCANHAGMTAEVIVN